MKLFVVLVSLFAVVACTPPSVGVISEQNTTLGIINGKKVSATDPIAKHLVAITDDRWENCTGTLIAKNLVLTAAHCETADKPMYVAFGLEVSERNIKKVVRFPVVDRRVLPGYEIASQGDFDIRDLMIVKFDGQLPAGYEPAEFLLDESALNSGAEALVAGYGVTNGETQSGNGFLKKTWVPIAYPEFASTEIATDETKSGTCNIDSGGPAFVELNGKYFYWGVTSRGSEDCNGFGIYTKISSYQQWIQETMKELNQP